MVLFSLHFGESDSNHYYMRHQRGLEAPRLADAMSCTPSALTLHLRSHPTNTFIRTALNEKNEERLRVCAFCHMCLC
jgi:hypothetical protein